MKPMEAPIKNRASIRCKTSAGKGRKDLLRRFTPTPYVVDLLIMAKTVRLESNSLTVVESALEFFARHQGRPLGDPEFFWRIVSQEDDSQTDQAGVALSAFSDHGLRFVNIGQRNFLAVDLEACEGIGFVAERLVESEPKLNCRPFFDTLFCMTAGSLGMVPLSAACVGLGEKGILLFGPPNSGKTTASYLAAMQGLEFHADQAVFLEVEAGELRVWGDFLPAIFRPESLQFLPELRATTRRFSYPGLTVHYLPKRPFQPSKARPVSPICSVFLHRGGACETHLAPILSSDLTHRLAESILFKDDDRFQQQTSTILHFLAKLPAHDLAYGSDPAMATHCVRQMLTDHDIAGELTSRAESDTKSRLAPPRETSA
jgi:hypothetical protein